MGVRADRAAGGDGVPGRHVRRSTIAPRSPAGAATLDDVRADGCGDGRQPAATRRAILDAGQQGAQLDAGGDDGFGLVLEAPGSTLEKLNEEHGYLALAGGDDLELGHQVRIVPNHACVAVNLFEELVGVRNGEVEVRWPVARGR